MATSTLAESNRKIGRLFNPDQKVTRAYSVTAGQTFKAGDIVYLVAAGTLSICAAPGANAGNILLAGRAGAGAARCLTENIQCPVYPLHGQEITIPVYHATPASAVIVAGDVDAPTSLPLRNQDGIMCLDIAGAGTNNRFTITGISPANRTGDLFTLVTARPIASGLLG